MGATLSRFDIRPTTYTEVATKALHLFEEHWQEVALNKALMVLKPDEAKYLQLEETGAFFGLAAYDGDEIVGYSGNFIGTHMHYAGLRYCNNDVLFVAKGHRASPLGLRLIRETVAEAARRGARLMLWHGKQDTPLADLLPKMDYKVQDVIYSRELAPSNFRLFGRLDVAAALAQTMASPLWGQFTARQDTPGSPHHDTKCIVLRGPDIPHGAELTIHDVFNKIESRDWQHNCKSLPAVTKLCGDVARLMRIRDLGRVMLVDLPPGGAIDRHFDDGAYAEHYDRFHLPLVSDPGNVFTCGDEQLHMRAGEVWQFNHRINHEVANNSSTSRVHLIIDAVIE